MSDSRRVDGSRVYCHVCEHEWERSQGGLQCPNCESEFVEVKIESQPQSQVRASSPPSSHHTPLIQSPRPDPLRDLHDHNPWAPDPDEDDITTFEFNNGNGRGTFTFTSRTYTFGGGTARNMDPMAMEVGQSFQTMLGNIMGLHNQRRQQPMMGGIFQAPQARGTARDMPGNNASDLFSMLFQPPSGEFRQPSPSEFRPPRQEMNPFDLLGAMINPALARHGDTVFSQEAFDRVMSQLMEQHQNSGAPGPASESAISALKKKPIDKDMMGSDGKAECSICMDGVELGQEVTVLPCNHWFHGECVVSWLKEHDTCPHCRKPISESTDASANTASSSSRNRRRSSRRPSSVSSPRATTESFQDLPSSPFNESPSAIREARQRYYGTRRDSDMGRSGHQRRRSSTPREPTADGNGSGGVTGWIRNHMPGW